MRRQLASVLSLLALVGCAAHPGASFPSPTPPGCTLPAGTEQLAAEFRDLRAVQGHFQGGAWNADVDAWDGRKHRAMVDLGARLGAGDCLVSQLRRLLGTPDQVARRGDLTFELVGRLPEFTPPAGPYELHIYHWRGQHDILYFAVQGDAVLCSGWWYSYE